MPVSALASWMENRPFLFSEDGSAILGTSRAWEVKDAFRTPIKGSAQNERWAAR
ncbi:hypothetical protein Fuma_03693 [Fuerstiella marisgermanici]|uniref:Uncharacterized protein n=1 Tax=Fuerstiella marisgermanici TaxID=1891926 RepID=A0A1P8WJ34_9PLAN|nr:hypothetical protein Fuma_03693 [Fuerstiella marisgermanici]